MKASLYEIPDGCICMGDGLLGMPCTAKEHARLKIHGGSMQNQPKRIVMFFENGNTAVFVGDSQAPELQQPWILLFLEWLEAQGEDPREFEFHLSQTLRAHVSKQHEGGGWTWGVHQAFPDPPRIPSDIERNVRR